jgi:secretion/DNA translocation related TadE-like protein
MGALAVGSAVLASHRARAAADLAALGAAVRLQAGDTTGACPRAGAVAGANGAALSACRPAADLSVVVEVEVPAPFLSRVVGHMAATARARAGPST